MKNLPQYVRLLLLFAALIPAQLNASPLTTPTPPASTASNNAAAIMAMENRLHEIKDMDKSKLSSSEKRELRKEVKEIKDAVKSRGGGIYLSVGAVIIILLLIIIL